LAPAPIGLSLMPPNQGGEHRADHDACGDERDLQPRRHLSSWT
jgi:hypothetical protein